MSQIVWLASYPKSGNTWLRVFLECLRSSHTETPDLNKLGLTHSIATSREVFDDCSGLPSSSLTFEEIEQLRPDVYRQLARSSDEHLFIKVHDANHLTANGDFLIPADVTFGAIYLVRNPLDVVVSLAYQIFGEPRFDLAIKRLNSTDFTLAADPNQLNQQLPVKFLDWSEHVRSWTEKLRFPTCVIRYEDMVMQPQRTFENVVKFLDMPHGPEDIFKASEMSSFERLSRWEDSNTFRERGARAARFFRQGKSGGWKHVLSSKQVRAIVNFHYETMNRLGYIDDKGEPVG